MCVRNKRPQTGRFLVQTLLTLIGISVALYFSLRKTGKSNQQRLIILKKLKLRKAVMSEAPHGAGFVMISYKIYKNQ